MKKISLVAALLLTVFAGCKKDDANSNSKNGKDNNILAHLKMASAEDADATITIMNSRMHSLIDGSTSDGVYVECLLPKDNSLQTFSWNGLSIDKLNDWNFFQEFKSSNGPAIMGTNGDLIGQGGSFPNFQLPFQTPQPMNVSVTGITNGFVPLTGSVTLSWTPDPNGGTRPIVLIATNRSSNNPTPPQVVKTADENDGSITVSAQELQSLGASGETVDFTIGRGNEDEDMVGGKKIYVLSVSYVMTTDATLE